MRGYIDELNAFYDFSMDNAELSPSARLLWHSLMMICNRARWENPLSVTNKQIFALCHQNKRTILRAREELQELGLIDFQPQPAGRATQYTVYSLSERGAKVHHGAEIHQGAVQKYTKARCKSAPNLRQEDKDNNISSNQLDESAVFEAPKQPKRSKKPTEDPPEFKRFYTEYPKHAGHKPALDAWLKLNPSTELAETIIAHVERRKRGEWRDKDKKYIPMASTFLNQQRWTDELETSESRTPKIECIDY